MDSKNLSDHIKQVESANENYIKDITFLKQIIDNLSIRIEDYKNKNDSLMEHMQKQQNENKLLTEENNNLKLNIKNLNHNLKNLENIIFFSNFNKFLSNSYVSPKLQAPFSDEQKRSFLIMDSIAEYLINNLNKLKERPLVSVIMPVYNRVDVVSKSIDSVLKQTYDNIELIVIDDGSDDGTVDLLKNIKNKKVKILYNKNNMGASFSRNKGLENASGEYVAYLDSDNDWDANYISTMIGGFLKLPDADAVYSGQILYEKYGSSIKGVRFGTYNKSLLHNKNYIDMNCFCHKKYIFDEIGGFDTKLKRLVDWDFILKISNNYKIYSIPILLSNYYSNNANNRIDNISFDKNEYTEYILKKNKFDIILDYKLKQRVNIILLNYESVKYIKECVETILSFKLADLKIIVINNNAEGSVVEYLNSLCSNNENIEVIHNDQKFKFTSLLNNGLKLCDDEADLLILNSVAILSVGAIEIMQYYAYNLDDVGLIIPQQVVNKKQKVIKSHVPYADYFYECDVNPSYNYRNIINIPIFHDGNILELNFAPFFCTYIKRDVFNKTCGFNKDFSESYYFAVLFSEYIRNILGLKIYHISDCIVKNNYENPKKYLDYGIYKYDFTKNVSSNNKFN